ncbi:MAG: metal-dependent transcriptional regulator [Clostridia bacterium]|nr:metal-dependent transcriptional regulator [Clostridia bacterium]
MKIQESGEMYLESILVLSKQKGAVRSIDVAEYLHYSKPSISRAMSILRAENYIRFDTNGYILLTEKGRMVAEKIYERHTVLTTLLTTIGVSPETATEDACRIEHVISDETFNIIKNKFKK